MSANFVIRFDLHHYHHLVNETELSKSIADVRSFLMSKFDELTAQLNAAADQAEKSKAEVVAAVGALKQTVTDLQAVIAAGGDVPPEVVTAANRVSSATQALDDLNPDAPSA